jgi:hypothetical protein
LTFDKFAGTRKLFSGMRTAWKIILVSQVRRCGNSFGCACLVFFWGGAVLFMFLAKMRDG